MKQIQPIHVVQEFLHCNPRVFRTQCQFLSRLSVEEAKAPRAELIRVMAPYFALGGMVLLSPRQHFLLAGLTQFCYTLRLGIAQLALVVRRLRAFVRVLLRVFPGGR